MKEKPQKTSKKKKEVEVKEPELTPKQLKEKRREEARAKAAETRKIVTAGTSAWTGKLPAQLLNEYCQKLKWERVEYPIKGSGEQFTASVIISKRNAKTKEIEKIKLEAPTGVLPVQNSPLEARHVAATYGLHRICSSTNMDQMLPPFHRGIWKDLDALKKEAPAKEAYKWSADPFAAQAERNAHQKKMQEIRPKIAEAAEKKRFERALHETVKAEKSSNALNVNQEEGAIEKERPHKVRYNSSVTIKRSLRTEIETVIRQHGGFTFSKSNALDKSSPTYSSIAGMLEKLGFVLHQIDEALEYTNKLSTALEWLLLHVPEDDLPRRFTHSSQVGVSTRISESLEIENLVSRLKQFGYSEEVALATAKKQRTFENSLGYLTKQFLPSQNDEVQEPGVEELWEQDCEAASAVYHEYVKQQTDRVCVLELKQIGITLWLVKPTNYPNEILGIGLLSSRSLPKYLLLTITRRAALFASDLIGDCMILSLVDYLLEMYDEICNSPDKLSLISSAVTGVDETYKVHKPVNSKTKSSQKSLAINLDPKKLKSKREQGINSENGKSMFKTRRALPAWKLKSDLVKLVKEHQVTLITGETGSGKSTQVVQFILDDLIESELAGNTQIICTQPRRISAIGVAQRVAQERDSNVGDQVGYIVRGETSVSSDTQIKFVTSGVLLRMLQENKDELSHITHIVVDEVHERSLDSDFLLILLKRLIRMNSKLKVILMSATIEPTQFINYFSSHCKVGHAHIPGRTFPVDVHYLNELIPRIDYVPNNLQNEGVTSSEVGQIITFMKNGVDFLFLARLVDYIHSSLSTNTGSILIFMSGVAEIDRSIRAIKSLDSAKDLWVLPLHASLPPHDQKLVFASPPRKKRKVVVSTNVAETSITIADIVAVIDSGRVKEALYESGTHVLRLIDQWTSKASSLQRQGRAGRIQQGDCYKLYTKAIFENSMPQRPSPEILRVPLDSLYLSVKSMGIHNVSEFLAGALDSPDSTAIESAKSSLISYGALEKDTDTLTPMGKYMSLIPTDPQTAKLLVLGVIFGCLPKCLTIAALLGCKSPLISSKENENNPCKNFDAKNGDLYGMLKAFDAWENNSTRLSRTELRTWTAEVQVSERNCRDIQSMRSQLFSSLTQNAIISATREHELPRYTWRNNENTSLLQAIIGAACYPNIAEIVFPEKKFRTTQSGALEMNADSRKIRYFTLNSERVFVHPSSTLFGVNKYVDDAHFLSYVSSIMSTKHYISSVTPLSAYGFLFFSNRVQLDPLGVGVLVEESVGIKCVPRVGILVQCLKNIFSGVLESAIANTNIDLSSNTALTAVIDLISTTA